MRGRANVWVLIAIILLVVATTFALARQAQNFNDHKNLDAHACQLALTNRELLLKTVDVFNNDPLFKDPPTVAKIAALDQQLVRLVAETKQACADD